jgi:hypothetical protein
LDARGTGVIERDRGGMRRTVFKNLFADVVILAKVDEGLGDGHGVDDVCSERFVSCAEATLPRERDAPRRDGTGKARQRKNGSSRSASSTPPSYLGKGTGSSRKSGPTPTILRANFRCPSVSASIKSLSPSTSVRSILPLKNACRVNSPRSAGLRGRLRNV